MQFIRSFFLEFALRHPQTLILGAQNQNLMELDQYIGLSFVQDIKKPTMQLVAPKYCLLYPSLFWLDWNRSKNNSALGKQG